MFRFPIIVRVLASLAALVLAGCIDSREEVWIDRDGGGRAEIRVEIPTAATRLHGGTTGVRRLIDSFLAESPDIRPTNVTVTTTADRTVVDVAMEFDSALKASEATGGDAIDHLPPAARHLTGEVETRLRGLTLDFNRVISPGEAIPGVSWLPKSQLEGHRLEYIIHLPAVAKTSNATRTENGGRTLVWDIPLATAVQQPFHTSFEMDLPIPWSKVSAVAIPLSLAGGWLLLRRVRKPAAEAADEP